jgi:hypothetical protein
MGSNARSLLQPSFTPLLHYPAARRSLAYQCAANISPVGPTFCGATDRPQKLIRLCAVTLSKLLARLPFSTRRGRFRSNRFVRRRALGSFFLGGSSSGTSARNFNVGELQIRKCVPQHCRFFIAQVAARLFLDHRQLIDKHFRDLEVYFALSGLRIGNLAKKKRGVLRLHHDKFDKSLRQLPGICAGLNFGHVTWISLLRAFLAVAQWRARRLASQNTSPLPA